jgi:DNA repair protein RadD
MGDGLTVSGFDLRPYQVSVYDDARALVQAGSRSILIQSPTGSGKTVLVAKMLDSAAQKGYRAWFNVHRRELVKQSVLTFTQATGREVGIVAAGFPGNRHLPIQICSIGTLRQRRKLLPDPNLIVWDEAHHSAAASWEEIHEAYPNAVHIGVSATPERLDGRGLGKYFKELIVGPSVAWLIEQGYLSRYKLYAPSQPDLSDVHTIAGDYNKKELNAAMNRSAVVGDVIGHYRRLANGKRMIVFAWSIEASIDIAAKFNAAGIKAEHVDGKTDDHTRDVAMERFKSGETKVLTNVDLFGEGIDVPAMEAVALLRPTQSLALYLQQVGRALRPFEGKEHALILDHAGNCTRFGLPDDERTWTLEGRKKGRAGEYATPIRQCHQCFAVVSAARDACPYCGAKFVAQSREIEQIEGELAEVEIKRIEKAERQREQAEAKTLDDLIKIGKLRGYKSPEKWAHHLYKARLAKQAGREAMNWLGLEAPGVNGRE